jgi:magnesium chelatase subunit D
MVSPSTLDHCLDGFAAAALDPQLRQILLFDADIVMLETAASLLKQLLVLTTQQAVHIVPLIGNTQEDDLWGSYMPSPPISTTDQEAGLSVTWQEGLLTRNREGSDWLLVVIPDLTRLSLPTARACLTLLNSPVVHLERHGHQNPPWEPRICWLAACSRTEVGQISPHLLDRFSLRLPASTSTAKRSSAQLVDTLQHEPVDRPLFHRHVPLSTKWKSLVTKKPAYGATLSIEGQEQLLKYSEGQVNQGVRRELTLARLGRFMAWKEDSHTITAKHIDDAAQQIGLKLPQLSALDSTNEPSYPVLKPQPSLERAEQSYESGFIESELATENNQPDKPDETTPVEPPASEIIGEGRPLSHDPYPEDKAPIKREQFALQLPQRRHRISTTERGSIIGIQPADSLQDLALFATLLEAAIYQPVRRAHNPDLAHSRLILSPTDLRRYRRVPPPSSMLLLLLDYTSLHDCEWQQALLPYLHWAYIERAQVVVVQVGHKSAVDELRAEVVSSRSLLSPRIAQTLESQAGRATPLAHGLEMAYQVIQQAQQHGRGHLQKTRFIIITDGRGNVPLEISTTSQQPTQIKRKGIDDALHVAQKFLSLNHLHTTLLDPQPAYYTELPSTLAETIGAQYIPVPLIPEAKI